MATHSSILDWKIPCSEEPGGLQSMELQRVLHDLGSVECRLINFNLKYFCHLNLNDCRQQMGRLGKHRCTMLPIARVL